MIFRSLVIIGIATTTCATAARYYDEIKFSIGVDGSSLHQKYLSSDGTIVTNAARLENQGISGGFFYSKTFFNIATLSTEGFYDSNSFVDKVYISNSEVLFPSKTRLYSIDIFAGKYLPDIGVIGRIGLGFEDFQYKYSNNTSYDNHSQGHFPMIQLEKRFQFVEKDDVAFMLEYGNMYYKGLFKGDFYLIQGEYYFPSKKQTISHGLTFSYRYRKTDKGKFFGKYSVEYFKGFFIGYRVRFS
jgi:hypothetical protein